MKLFLFIYFHCFLIVFLLFFFLQSGGELSEPEEDSREGTRPPTDNGNNTPDPNILSKIKQVYKILNISNIPQFNWVFTRFYVTTVNLATISDYF